MFIEGVECNKSEREIRTFESRYDRDVHAQGTHRERVHVKYGNSTTPGCLTSNMWSISRSVHTTEIQPDIPP